MPAIALTDQNNLFAALEFATGASNKGVQPINGVIANISYSYKGNTEFAEILILAQNQKGYQNLLKLGSYAYLKNHHKTINYISWEDLTECAEGLIVLSGYHKGFIGKLLLSQDYAAAKKVAQKMQELFQDRFYFEIMRHNEPEEKAIEAEYIKLGLELDIAFVATNQVLFADIKMWDAHDTLLCISAGTVKDDYQRTQCSKQCYFKSQNEMVELFRDIPGAVENSVNIAKRCSVMAVSNEPMLPNFGDGTTDERAKFRAQALEGLEKRLEIKFELDKNRGKKIDDKYRAKVSEIYHKRLEYELQIICDMNFAGYFLIVSDFIKWSKQNNIPVGPGRGSGAGSIVAWSLLITDLDPIEFGLLFERFLNPERVSMPDFDIDFCQEKREKVINYVRQKYGDDRVAQIITFGKLQAKAVIKDVARVLRLPYHIADNISKLVPFNAVNPVTLSDAIKDVPELKDAARGKGLYNLSLTEEDKELIRNVIDTALQLEGLHRHASIHAAGIIISGINLMEVVPLYQDANTDMYTIQYSMKYAELAGLVKFDFLGLKTLTVISKCVKLLKHQGINVEIEKLTFDDPATFQMLSQGMSTGVFQFESAGMKDSLRKLKPDCIEDLIALGALYRPGPMDNIPTYIACKHGRKKPDYLEPKLKGTLEETYGVIIYQEQVMEIAQKLAGYSLGAADLLRRAMGKKIKAEMDAQEQIFIEGAKKKKLSETRAREIFALVAKFAGYGFNKSHAAAYAVISYQTAYLKANFLCEFLTASLNLEIHDTDKLNIFIQEAKIYKLPILTPNINKSEAYFAVSYKDNNQKSINFALGALKNIGIGCAEAIVNERENGGDFKSVFDFIQRIHSSFLNKRIMENLIKSGAFDSLHNNRAQLLSSVKLLLDYGLNYRREKESKQMSLMSLLEDEVSSYPALIEIDDFSKDEKAYKECDAIGFFLDSHPLEHYTSMFESQNITNSLNLRENLENGNHNCRIAGIIQTKDSRMSARGRFVTMQLSDPFGMFEVSIFNEDIFKQNSEILEVKSAIVISADIRKDEGGIRITANRIESLPELIKNCKNFLQINITTAEEMEKLLNFLNDKRDNIGGNTIIEIISPAYCNFNAIIGNLGNFTLNIGDINHLKEEFKILEPV